MDFGETPGTIADSSTKRAMLGTAAQAMAADIRTVMQTQTLTVSEKAQLMSVLTEIVGDAELAAAYVEQVSAGADADAGMVSANVDESGESGYNTEETREKILTQLSRAQRRNIIALDNIIENNLTDNDFSGTLADLQGNPIPKKNGGFWDHLTEMRQSYKALLNIKRGLEGSLQNPNLPPEVREFLMDKLEAQIII